MFVDSIELMLREYVMKLVDERVAEALKSMNEEVISVIDKRIEVRIAQDAESHMETVLNRDLQESVESLLDKHDFSDDVKAALDQYDFTKVVDDIIDDHDFSTVIREEMAKIMEDARVTISIPD